MQSYKGSLLDTLSFHRMVLVKSPIYLSSDDDTSFDTLYSLPCLVVVRSQYMAYPVLERRSGLRCLYADRHDTSVPVTISSTFPGHSSNIPSSSTERNLVINFTRVARVAARAISPDR